MQLIMRRKIFSLKRKYTITEKAGSVSCYVEGNLLSIKNKRHVYDVAFLEIVFMYRKLISLLPRCYLYIKDFSKASS
jgi:uncharacterized protein YxjI